HCDAGRNRGCGRGRAIRRAQGPGQELGMSAGIVILGMALINLALRCPIFLMANRIRIPRIVEKALAHCPVAVLTAIIVPFALPLDNAPDGSQWLNPDLFATFAAIATSLLTRNLMATVAAGLGAALLLRYLALL